MIRKFEHVAIAAADTTALTNWYQKVFGWEIVYNNGKEPPTYFLKTPDGDMLEIIPAKGSVQTDKATQGVRHIALETDDFENDVKILTENDVEIIDAPATSASGVSTVFFKDLEGNILHYIQRVKKL